MDGLHDFFESSFEVHKAYIFRSIFIYKDSIINHSLNMKPIHMHIVHGYKKFDMFYSIMNILLLIAKLSPKHKAFTIVIAPNRSLQFAECQSPKILAYNMTCIIINIPFHSLLCNILYYWYADMASFESHIA